MNPTKPNRPELTVSQRRIVAASAGVDLRTLDRYLSGEPTRPSITERIEVALRGGVMGLRQNFGGGARA